MSGPKVKTDIDPQVVARIRAALRAGVTLRDVCRRFDIGPDKLKRVLAQAGAS